MLLIGPTALVSTAIRDGMDEWVRGSMAIATDEHPDYETVGEWSCWFWGRAVDAVGRQIARPARVVAERAMGGRGDTLELRGAWIAAISSSVDDWSVAHDHLGARGLVHASASQGEVVSEHLVDILRALPVTPQPDRLTVTSWLENNEVPYGRSFFAGIHRLPPGRLLRLDASGRAETATHWSPQFREPISVAPLEQEEHLAAAVDDAVTRSVAGASLPAVRLSGGLDSSTLLAALSRLGRPAMAFTTSFPGTDEADEAALARETAQFCAVPHVVIPWVARSALEAMAEAARRWMVPSVSPIGVMSSQLYERARESGVDLLLDGEGGDELFGARPEWLQDLLLRGRIAAAVASAGRLPGMGPAPDRAQRLRVLRANGLAPLMPLAVRNRNPPHPFVIAAADAARLADLPAPSVASGPRWWQATVRMMMVESELFDASAHLRRGVVTEGPDRRYPFLHDVDLLEAVLRTAPQAMYDGTLDRPLLRRAMRSRVPEPVLRRTRKAHFNHIVIEDVLGAAGQRLRKQIGARASVAEYVAPDALARINRGVEARRTEAVFAFIRLVAVHEWLIALDGR